MHYYELLYHELAWMTMNDYELLEQLFWLPLPPEGSPLLPSDRWLSSVSLRNEKFFGSQVLQIPNQYHANEKARTYNTL